MGTQIDASARQRSDGSWVITVYADGAEVHRFKSDFIETAEEAEAQAKRLWALFNKRYA